MEYHYGNLSNKPEYENWDIDRILSGRLIYKLNYLGMF